MCAKLELGEGRITKFIQQLEPAFNVNVGSEKLVRF